MGTTQFNEKEAEAVLEQLRGVCGAFTERVEAMTAILRKCQNSPVGRLCEPLCQSLTNQINLLQNSLSDLSDNCKAMKAYVVNVNIAIGKAARQLGDVRL